MNKKIILSITSMLLLSGVSVSQIEASGFKRITADKSQVKRSEKTFNKLFAINYSIGANIYEEEILPSMSFGLTGLRYLNDQSNLSFGFISEISFIKNKNNYNSVTNTFGSFFKTDLLLNYNITYDIEAYYGIGMIAGNDNHNNNIYGINNVMGLGYNVSENMNIGVEYNYNNFLNLEENKTNMSATLKLSIKY